MKNTRPRGCPTVVRLLSACCPPVVRLLSDCRPTVVRLLSDCYCSSDCCPTVAERWAVPIRTTRTRRTTWTTRTTKTRRTSRTTWTNELLWITYISRHSYIFSFIDWRQQTAHKQTKSSLRIEHYFPMKIHSKDVSRHILSYTEGNQPRL